MTHGTYKKLGNVLCHVGPAGIHCNCCAPIRGTVKKNRIFLNRVFRRKSRQNIYLENF